MNLNRVKGCSLIHEVMMKKSLMNLNRVKDCNLIHVVKMKIQMSEIRRRLKKMKILMSEIRLRRLGYSERREFEQMIQH
jgi:hypothetical protein